VSSEKQNEVSEKCRQIFYSYQNQLSEFTYRFASERKIVSAIKSQNVKKAYEVFAENPNINQYNVEVYNSRLELFLFSGRQLNPEILELKRSYDGIKFSVVKEIGLYTYLIVYEPLKDEMGVSQGVLVAASIIDVNSYIQNSYFINKSITNEIFKAYHTSVFFIYGQDTFKSLPDELSGQIYTSYNLKGVNENAIGKLYIPSLDKDSYLNSVNNKFNNLVSFLLFVSSLLVIL